MKDKTIAMIHTVSSLVPLFDKLGKMIIKNINIIHIADEAVLNLISTAGHLTKEACRRICDDTVAAEAAGANLILYTCSSISPCADVASQLCSVPILKVDQAMIEEAVSIGTKIGVIATAKTTLEPTINQVKQYAIQNKKSVAVNSYLIEDAFIALKEKNLEKHDQLIISKIHQAMKNNDVIILAQASMARALEGIENSQLEKPILTSPERAVRFALTKLNQI